MEQNNETDQISEEKAIKNFETFKKFLRTDMQIKEALFRAAPSELDDYNEESRIEYTDKLDRFLKDFEVSFKLISDGFEFGDEVSTAIHNFFKKSRENLAFGKYESGIGSSAYQKNFSNMRPKFIDEVKGECIGYTCATPERLADLMGKATTVNEMLHVMHSFIMNNEEIMGSMPKVGEKNNSLGYPIRLYGEPSLVANEIFEKFPNELDVGFTDIVSTQGKVFMMIRDRGHALTIDMDTSKADEADVKYFVPKLCNEEMIKALKGIDKSSISQNGARGSFITKTEEITEELFGFIEKVPTDDDIPRVQTYRNIGSTRELPKEENQDIHEVPIIDTVEPIFSTEDAKTMSVEPERKISGMKKIITKIINPLKEILKSKDRRNKEHDNEGK